MIFKLSHSATVANSYRVDKRSLIALAVLLLLAQLPHLTHLPAWVGGLGAIIVAGRLLQSHYPDNTSLKLLLSPIVMAIIATSCALLIRWHYGYFLGRDPCVAFLFLLVACKFAEIRRTADATLLLCLASFLLLTQFFYSQTILSAIITLPAVLALGHALAVLRDPTHSANARTQVKLVVKLLLQGAPIAALLFVVFPRLPGPLWSLPDDAMAKTGLSDSMQPGNISRLSQSDEVAFRVEFHGPVPPMNQRYWRGPVLTEFDGQGWSMSPRLLVINEESPTSTDTIEYTVTLQPHQQRWLFALEHTTQLPHTTHADAKIEMQAQLTSDHQLFNHVPVKKVIRYRQQSDLGASFRPIRAPSVTDTQLVGKNTQTAAFAQAQRRKTGSDIAYIESLLSWFHSAPFRYTLEPTLLGDNPVDEFLFDTRNGFCEHYASAFVVLLRAAAIPARIVTGYLGGEMNGDYMIVRQSDAHAWTEAFINGRWRRFDPTGAVAPSRVETNMAAALGDGEPVPQLARIGNHWVKRLQLNWDAMNYDWQRLIVDFDNDTQSNLWQILGLPKPQLWQLTSIVIGLSAAWCFVVLGLPGMNRIARTSEERLWLQFCALLKKRGITKAPSEPPQAFVDRATRLSHHDRQRVAELGNALIRLRFEHLVEPALATQKRIIRRRLRNLRLSNAALNKQFWRGRTTTT